MHRCLVIATVALSFTACKKKPKEEAAPPTGSGTAEAGGSAGSATDTGSGTAGSDTGSGSAGAASAFDPGELQTPESVLYDEGRDMYIVSNINGKATEADDNGYLTVVNPDGSNERANANWKWIMGEMPDIKLDAPKGMAISGDTLYVTDVTVLRRFEAKSGKQKDDVAIAGASFLNDVTPDGQGGVYLTDSGLAADFSGNGGDAVYHVDRDGKVKALAKGKELGNPNGIWFDGKGTLWVVTFGSGELYDLDAKTGKRGQATKLPTGQLDGIVGLEGGDLAITSWEGKCVYRGKPGGEWSAIVKDVESPADLGYDPKRKRLMIPGFNTNKITIHQL